jgi:hypothetical protein
VEETQISLLMQDYLQSAKAPAPIAPAPPIEDSTAIFLLLELAILLQAMHILFLNLESAAILI